MSELFDEAIATFHTLLAEARESGEVEPTAMSVTTVRTWGGSSGS